MNWGIFVPGLIAAFILTSLPASAQDQQIGARTKAMGGSYTAFEDDPVSIWLNPAGIATQQDQLGLSYQTYTAYQVEKSPGINDEILFDNDSESILIDPAIIPSFLGAVFQIGSPEHPMAIGICYARPYQINYAADQVETTTFQEYVPDSSIQQSLGRFRAAFAYDLRLKEPGESGFFHHIAFGLGLDIGFINWEFENPTTDEDDTATGYGFGFGILTTVYDNTRSFRVNFGIAYQSAIQYDFSIEPELYPSFDMPQQFNAGFTFYLLEGTPLRLTVDFQWIEWSESAENPAFEFPFPRFEDATNFSVGMEYRVSVSERILLYPRLGMRYLDAPWGDPDDLPVTGGYRLVLGTEEDVFAIFSFGVGISWTTEEGQLRTIDLAGDTGGDSFTAAIGYTHEF